MPNVQVLIADDDPLLRDILEHKLAAAGYGVTSVGDGQAALDALAPGGPGPRPQLVVLDAMMPIMDGFEVLRRMKADPLLAQVVVVMLTALKRQDDVLGALRLGAQDYISKPFNPDELVARLERLAAPLGVGP